MRLGYFITPRRVGLVLGALAVYLALQNLITEYLVEVVLDQDAYPTAASLLDLFSVNTEDSIPTWYASLLLFIAAVLLFMVGHAVRLREETRAWSWFGLSAIFVYLSLDEGTVIHEIGASWVSDNFAPSGFFAFGWHFIAIPLLLVFALVYFRFWLRLPPRTRIGFAVAGILYVGGAFFIEGISAAMWDDASGQTYPYLVVATLEELCEMLGAVVFISVLVGYLADRGDSLLLTPSHTAPDTTPVLSNRRRWAVIGGVVALANIALIAGVTSLPMNSQAGGAVYPSLVDQLTVNGVVLARAPGRLGFNAAPDPLVVALADQFPAVTAISLVATDITLVLAGETIPLSYNQLVEILHDNGETQFIILDDAAVRLILRRAAVED